jgi:hypothetical protein
VIHGRGQAWQVQTEGMRMTFESSEPRTLLMVLATLLPLDDDFPAICELPVDDVEL